MSASRALRDALDGDYLFKILLVLLAYAVIPLGEIFFFLFLGSLIGNYLVLALAAVSGVVGAFVGIPQARRTVERMKAHVGRTAPAGDVHDIVGLGAAAVLLVTPGFLTDLAGFLLLVPGVRVWIGARLTLILRSRAPRVFEKLGLAGR